MSAEPTPPKTPPKQDPPIDAKPKVTKVEDPPVDDKFTIHIEGDTADLEEKHTSLQKEFKALQKQVKKAEDEKNELERATVLTEISQIDNKLAESNKESSLEVLKTVLDTASTMHSTIPLHIRNAPVIDATKPRPGVVGSRNLDTGEWEDLGADNYS
jgi:seryl-tRNA synthetase